MDLSFIHILFKLFYMYVFRVIFNETCVTVMIVLASPGEPAIRV